MSEQRLYIVYFAGAQAPVETDSPDIYRLDEGVYLVQTDQTRSQLYHAIKRRTHPEKLLVAPLADDPKFKGMEEGALKWLRAL